VTVYCPKCYSSKRYRLAELPSEHVCCVSVKIDPAVKSKRTIDVCAVCGLGYFYVQTNFNRALGCLVMLAAVAAFVYFIDHWWAAMILIGTAGFDLILYLALPKYAICYKCLTEYRGFQRNPEHKAFDLATGQHFADGPKKPD
jgi:hypothetical protein